MELISRENVLNYLQRGINFWYEEDEKAHEALEMIKSGIESLSIIESRPKGEWIDREGKETKSKYCGYCSECGGWSEYLTDFCGNCGADKRGKE